MAIRITTLLILCKISTFRDQKRLNLLFLVTTGPRFRFRDKVTSSLFLGENNEPMIELMPGIGLLSASVSCDRKNKQDETRDIGWKLYWTRDPPIGHLEDIYLRLY